jgi:type II secretory pathway pseudopilin PulG
MINRWDRKKRAGFTIIEIMIFLAISGILIIGVIAGSGVITARHRYNDSVQNLTELLRSQYSAVINTQIADRTLGDVSSTACLGPSLTDVTSGWQVDINKFAYFYNPDGTLKRDTAADAGRGRTNCLVYGLMMTFGGNNGGTIQVSPLIGRDITADLEADRDLSDLELLQLSGADNLAVSFQNFTFGSSPGTGSLQFNNPDNMRCWVRSVGGSYSYNLEWGASVQAPPDEDGNRHALSATVLIFRSPKNGAIRTFVHHGFIGPSDGWSFSAAEINDQNGGRGLSLAGDALNPAGGSCNGNLNTGSSDTGFNFWREASINDRFTAEDASGNPYFSDEDPLILCVESDDIFALNGQRRMIRIAADGRSSSAVELVNLDSMFDETDNPTGNKC